MKITSNNEFIVSVDCAFESSYAVRIWSLPEKKQLAALFGHTDQIYKLSVTSDDAYIITASYDKTIRIWGLENRTQIDIIYHSYPFIDLEISVTSRYFAYYTDRVYLYDLQKRAMLYTFEDPLKALQTENKSRPLDDYEEFESGNNIRRLMLGSDDEVEEVPIDEKVNDCCEELEKDVSDNEDYGKESVDRSDNDYIKSIRKQAMLNKNERSDAVVNSWGMVLDEKLSALAITSDNKCIICGYNDGTLRIWNIRKKREEFTLDGHRNNVNIVVWTCDYRYIISCSNDDFIRIWNVETRKQEALLEKHHTVHSIALTKFSKYIILDCNYEKFEIYHLNRIIARCNRNDFQCIA